MKKPAPYEKLHEFARECNRYGKEIADRWNLKADYENIPHEFTKFIVHVRRLKFKDDPEYEYYRELFRNVLIRQNVWELDRSDVDNIFGFTSDTSQYVWQRQPEALWRAQPELRTA